MAKSRLGVLAAAGLLAASQICTAAEPESSSPREVAERFARALQGGDAAGARALLLPTVLVYESGGVEQSLAEYARHHLAADIEFLSGMRRQVLSQASGGEGDTAWVTTAARISGRYKDKDIDLDSTETLVLARTGEGWRIAHIHWSSAPRAAR